MAASEIVYLPRSGWVVGGCVISRICSVWLARSSTSVLDVVMRARVGFFKLCFYSLYCVDGVGEVVRHAGRFLEIFVSRVSIVVPIVVTRLVR